MLAFDGGSTKTDVVLVSRSGALLGRARVGPSNHQLVGVEGTVQALTEAYAAVTAAAQRSGAPSPLCPTGVYCLAGIDLPVDEEKLGAGDRRAGMDRAGHPAQRHLRRLAGRDDGPLGHRRRVRNGHELRRRRAGRTDGALSRTGRAVGGLRTRRRLVGPACPRPRPAGRRRPGRRHHACASECRHSSERPTRKPRSTGIYTGAIPYARLFELARVLLDAAAEGDAPAREMADILADEITAFVRAAVVRLDLQDEAVEVVLGGGIFDTTDTAFHARVAAGIHAAAPRATLVRLDAPPVLGAALIGLDAEDAPLRAALASPPPGAAAGARTAHVGPHLSHRLSAPLATAGSRRPDTPAGTWGMASATSRSSSANREWARSLTMAMISGCSSGFQPSRSSVSPVAPGLGQLVERRRAGRREVEVAARRHGAAPRSCRRTATRPLRAESGRRPPSAAAPRR